MKRTLYEILAVDPQASAEDIAAAYSARMADLNASPSQDAAALALLREAHQILCDANKRAAYDASLAGRPTSRPPADWKPEVGSVPAWGKWLVAAGIVIGIGVWLATPTRRESLPVQKEAPKMVLRQPPSQAPAPAERSKTPIETTESAAVSDSTGTATPTPSPAQPDAPRAARSAEDVFAEVAPSVALVNVSDAAGRAIVGGSGVVIEQGVVVTNCHVVKSGARITVKLGSKTMPATVQLADEAFDLCRLNVPGLEAPAVTIGNVGSLRTGQRVYAIGAPVGLELTISEGIVSALREVDGGTVIQTTAPISPGSSGGGLFDTSGRLVGIMTFQHRYGQNLNFAVPADWIGQMRVRSAVEPARQLSGERARDYAALILGQWTCHGSITGRAGQYNFERDGTLNIAMADGKTGTLRYRVSGKVLQLADDEKGGTLLIEELVSGRMVLHTGADGRRLVCVQ